MSNKATIEIDVDNGTVSVHKPLEGLGDLYAWPIVTTKAELVATILAMQSRELMAMNERELEDRQLEMLGIKSRSD